MNDKAITHPNHYVRDGIEVMEVQKAFGVEMTHFWRGSAIKYILRAPFKGHFIEDMRKCVQCCEYCIAAAENKDKENR